jgi:tRNA pseudouridine38-40 synthase
MENYRYFLTLAYNGSQFHGWQAQKNAHSVQQEIEKALFYILNKKTIPITGAGRTDTGVHARKYTAHFDLDVLLSDAELTRLIYRLNHLLPASIGIFDAYRVLPDAHARFSALSRTYRYYICRNHDPFSEGLSYRLTVALNLDLMNEASSLIIESKDFTCFAKTGTQTKTNVCNVTKCEWELNDNYLIFTTQANRFLRNMVRAMIGTLIDVGKEKITIKEFRQILNNGTRSDAGQSVPACGLFLEEIEYPANIRM